MIQQFHLWVLSEGNKTTILKRHLHLHVHYSIICNSQEMEWKQLNCPSTHEWIEKIK